MLFETLKTLCRFASLPLKEVARWGEETSLNSLQRLWRQRMAPMHCHSPGTSIMQSGITLNGHVTQQAAAETAFSSDVVLFEAYWFFKIFQVCLESTQKEGGSLINYGTMHTLFPFCGNRCVGGRWSGHMLRYDWTNSSLENSCWLFLIIFARSRQALTQIFPISSLIRKDAQTSWRL